MKKPPGNNAERTGAPSAPSADPTLEMEGHVGADGDEDDQEFDGPTQLVDAGSYATVQKAPTDQGGPTQEVAPILDVTAVPSREEAPSAPAPPAAKPKSRGSLFPDLPHVHLPQRLGQYTLIELLGLGGMAEVFLAQQDGPSGFRRKLVIKRIHPHLSVDERFVQMFLREARVAAGLQHRNIVRIDELGEDGGIYFIAMEFVEGLTLLRLARRAWRSGLSLPMELAVSAAADAATALHYAHSYIDVDGSARRIVHRDVSPDNLIVDRAGNTKLLDFGVAKAAGSISVTRAGEVKGKVPYMAPEQLHGKPLDGRADLYSLGATLYWLLTGRRPFHGGTDLEVMQAIAYETPVPPRELNAEIPELLDTIIQRLLSKKPEDRHENGQVLADELAAMLPSSRREVAAFVEEALELDNDDDGDPVSSSSFIAATPRTAHFITESRRLWLERYLPESPGEAVADAIECDLDRDTEDDVAKAGSSTMPLAPDAISAAYVDEQDEVALPEVRSARRLPVAAIGAGAAGAAVLAALGLVLFGTEDEPSPPPFPIVATASASADATDDGAWDFLGTEPSEQKAEGDEEASDAEPSQQPPSDEAAVAAPLGHVDEGDAQAEAADDEPAVLIKPTAKPSPAAEARRDTAQRTAVALKKVTAVAPSDVVWKLGKRTLGTGEATFEVPEGTTSLTAFHKRRKVRTRVPLRGDSVSYRDAPMGTLDIRVFPFAVVYAGEERLLKVPAPPKEVPVGTYKLRIEHDGKSKTETVTVSAGKTTKVRVNMTQ